MLTAFIRVFVWCSVSIQYKVTYVVAVLSEMSYVPTEQYLLHTVSTLDVEKHSLKDSFGRYSSLNIAIPLCI